MSEKKETHNKNNNHPKKKQESRDDAPILAPPPTDILPTTTTPAKTTETIKETTTTTTTTPAGGILESTKETLNWTKDVVVNSLETIGEKMGITTPSEETKPLLEKKPTDQQQHTLLSDVSAKTSQITSTISSAVVQGYGVVKEKAIESGTFIAEKAQVLATEAQHKAVDAGTFISEKAQVLATEAQHLASDIQHKVSETIHPAPTTTTEVKDKGGNKEISIDSLIDEAADEEKGEKKKSSKNKRNERSPKHEDMISKEKSKGVESTEERGEKFMRATDTGTGNEKSKQTYADVVKQNESKTS